MLIPAFAKSEELKNIYLAKIASDYAKSKYYELSINVNDKNEIVSIQSTRKPNIKKKIYGASILEKEMTLVKTVGIKLVTMKCHKFTATRGCDIEISYPRNITLAKFRSFFAQLRKIGGKWGLYSAHGDKFNRLNLISNKVLGLLVGIREIQMGNE